MDKILVIGDAHVTNGQSLRRFQWLNKLLRSRKDITHVYIMGDFLTLNSLSAWDKDKRLLMEDRRLFKEIEAGNTALNLLFDNVDTSKIKIIYIEGNHEDRLTRYTQVHSELSHETFTIPSLIHLSSKGIRWVPYRSYSVEGGIHFTHIPFGKAKEISGKDICSKAELVTTASVVFGHTHELHTSCVHKHGMKHLQQIYNAGCFFEKEEDYVEGKMTNYWKGVSILTNYSYGRFDIETISMHRLQYG